MISVVRNCREGDSVEISCGCDSPSSRNESDSCFYETIHWEKITSKSRRKVASGNTLRIENVTIDTDGLYRCSKIPKEPNQSVIALFARINVAGIAHTVTKIVSAITFSLFRVQHCRPTVPVEL